MMKLLVLSVFLLTALLLAGSCYSQSSTYQKGFVVTNNGDTINGWIDYRQWDKNPDEIKFKKDIVVIKLKKEDMQKFVGEYELSGVKAKIYLKGDSTLFLFVPGQPEYELSPVKPDEFNLKAVSGFSVKFLMNDKKETEAMQFIQPNGIFKATKVKTN